MTRAQRFARLVTDLVVRRPLLWRRLRGRLRRMFDALAPTWELRIGPDHLAALEPALAGFEPPRRTLDLGTGTGAAATFVAALFSEAEVVGVDLSPRMVAEAEARRPAELDGRLRYEVGDAARLRFPDRAFQLVVLQNMIPFFDELARVTAEGGAVVISFAEGRDTPIYVAPERLRLELGRRGFAEFAEFSAGRATALRATRQ